LPILSSVKQFASDPSLSEALDYIDGDAPSFEFVLWR
jgi:hypothetical protein